MGKHQSQIALSKAHIETTVIHLFRFLSHAQWCFPWQRTGNRTPASKLWKCFFFNFSRLKSKARTSKLLIRDILFAYDCARLARKIDGIQMIAKAFARSARRFGLTINLTKTEVMYERKTGTDSSAPIISIDSNLLNVTDKFTYLNSTLSQNTFTMSCLQRQSATAHIHPSFPQFRLRSVFLQRNVCSSS